MNNPTRAELVIAKAIIDTAAKVTAAPISMMTALILADAALVALDNEYGQDVEHVMNRIMNGDQLCDGYCHDFCRDERYAD